ncbi:MAG: hypothetical protein M3N93_14455 [Acidobacteriota bacterium]|nr:hypothetical protein [Acidobacteriota bacterium]
MNLLVWLRGLRQSVRAHLPARPAENPELRFPIRRPVRIALLQARFRTAPNIRSFSPEEIAWLPAWKPEALVMPLNLALAVADQKQRGLFALPSLNTAIVVLTSTEDSPLAAHHRDLLWQAFGVPIFEQLLAPGGHAIARECEVHDGLHLDTDEPIYIDGEIVTDPCACGLDTPRLRSRTLIGAKAVAGGSH